MTVLVAPAKLTVSLRVVGVRPDGMHLIDAEMVSLDLVDTLTLTEPPKGDRPTLRIASEESAAAGLPVTNADDNLVFRAMRVANRFADVDLLKRIPAGGGLGGGSSDAAAILRWAGRTSTDEDVSAAASLGADVVFCLRGGRAKVTGVGERIDPLPFVARSFTLLTPPFGVSTPAVYRAWDELGGPQGDNGNDLEPAAIVVEPRLAVWRDRLGEATGQTPRLAGSGSTWFVEGAFGGEGRMVTNTVDAIG